MKGMKIGVDFGSYSLNMCTVNRQNIVDEFSVAAIFAENGSPIAFGKNADELLGRTDSDINIVNPITSGVISDFTCSERILTYYLSKVCGNRIYKPNVVIALPTDVSSLEKKIFLDAVTRAGAGRVCLIEGVLASAIGSGISLEKIGGRAVIDLGHQTTEIAIISMGTVVASATIRQGSSNIDEAISRHLKKDRDIIIGPHTAREIKRKIAFAKERKNEVSLMVSGKSGIDEMPISFEITSTEIFPYIDEQLALLTADIRNCLDNISPELLGDAADHGITLCGGGALLFDVAERFKDELSISCSIADAPEKARIRGLQEILKNDSIMENNGYQYIFKDDIRDRLKRFDKI